MKGAVMQPYFFPYIGYYQLAYEVEKFVFFDDVNYIKKGYINRNSILMNGALHQFTIPVVGVSQNKKINEHFYVGDFSQFLEKIRIAYRWAPCFNDIFPMIQEAALGGNLNVAEKNAASIKLVFDYLGLDRSFYFSSGVQNDPPLKGQARIIDLCKKINVNEYVNAIGGRELYSQEDFGNEKMDLKFIKSDLQSYPQSSDNFVPNLSMIDVLMWNDASCVLNLLNKYSVIQ